jgi:hypothetical protein
MALSFKPYTADGIQTDFQVTFDYLDESHIRVRVDKVYTDEVGAGYKFEWINSNTVRVTTLIDSNPAPAGTKIDLIRRTPINTPAVIFGGGASLTTANLNKNSEYLTYALQEATDANEEFTKLYLGSFDTAPTSDNDGDTLQVGAVYYDATIKALFYWTGDEWIVGESTFAAETSRLAAEAAQAAAEAARDAAATSASNAAASESAAAVIAASTTQDVTDADNARIAAEAARTAAETAQSNAETAETNAATSQAAAETAKTDAEAAQAAAETAKTDLETARDAAQASANAASTSESNAATSESNAASSESNAATSEANAAASAAAAATFDPTNFVTQDGGGNITISTSDPSGGSDGDIWIKVE